MPQSFVIDLSLFLHIYWIASKAGRPRKNGVYPRSVAAVKSLVVAVAQLLC